jgi:hypothetical protein
MANETTEAEEIRAPERGAPWAIWLAWTWVLLLGLAAVAEVFGLEGLRLALDFQRHLR